MTGFYEDQKKEYRLLVSVIIPVYNAQEFVSEAVESAINLAQVGEIILVEDGSPDNALEVCLKLEMKYKKVRVLRHEKGKNKGASASRNLGINQSKFQYIAFLDADDWYLPNRFEKDEMVWEEKPNTDLIFSYPVMAEERKNFEGKKDPRAEIGANTDIRLFYEYFIKSRFPFFHTNTVTIRKDFLVQDKMFDERLRLHQDSELWLRLLRRGEVQPGNLKEPVAVIRRHEKNRITGRSIPSRLKMDAAFIQNVGVQNLYSFEEVNLCHDILRSKSKEKKSEWNRRIYYYSRIPFVLANRRKFLASFVDQTLG